MLALERGRIAAQIVSADMHLVPPPPPRLNTPGPRRGARREVGMPAAGTATPASRCWRSTAAAHQAIRSAAPILGAALRKR